MTCPSCHAILGIIPDPDALAHQIKGDIAQEVQKKAQGDLANLQAVLVSSLNEFLHRLGR